MTNGILSQRYALRLVHNLLRDDIISFSQTPQEHIQRLRGICEKLWVAGLKLNPPKCEFFQSQISYLGHIVSKEGIETDPKKISAICDWPQPLTVTKVCNFLGFTNYYRKFIHMYMHITKPLNTFVSGDNAKSKKKLVEWNEDCETAFQKLKPLCSETPILAYANYSKPFCLQMDASEKGFGTVLYQIQNDSTTRVIAYASRTLSESEKNYDAHKLQFLALK